MKRVLALVAGVFAALIAAGVAMADARGPACAEITDTTWSYSSDGTTATVTIFVEAATCPKLSYSLFAQDSLTDSTPVGSASLPGDGEADNTTGPGTDSITVTANVAEQDGTVCLYATTSRGRHVSDRAPNEGQSPQCIELTPGGTAAGGGFN